MLLDAICDLVVETAVWQCLLTYYFQTAIGSGRVHITLRLPYCLQLLYC